MKRPSYIRKDGKQVGKDLPKAQKGKVQPYQSKSLDDYNYRKQMYNDSLALHNFSQYQFQNELENKPVSDQIVDIGFGFLPVYRGERDYSKRVFNYAKNLAKNNPRIKIGLPTVRPGVTEEDYKREGSTDVYHDIIKPASIWIGDAVNAFYKKPIQEVLPPVSAEIKKDTQTANKKSSTNKLNKKVVKELREPIYVEDPNDPRLRAYSDSLNLYNKEKKLYEEETKLSYDKLLKMPHSNIPGQPGYGYTLSGKPLYGYKKPVQPVKYKKKEKQERTREYTDPIEYQKALQAYTDSTSLYNSTNRLVNKINKVNQDYAAGKIDKNTLRSELDKIGQLQATNRKVRNTNPLYDPNGQLIGYSPVSNLPRRSDYIQPIHQTTLNTPGQYFPTQPWAIYDYKKPVVKPVFSPFVKQEEPTKGNVEKIKQDTIKQSKQDSNTGWLKKYKSDYDRFQANPNFETYIDYSSPWLGPQYYVREKKKFGGSLPKAQKGLNEPIFVEDPNDPRLRAYNDSLNLYRLSNRLARSDYRFAPNYSFPSNPKYGEDYLVEYSPTGIMERFGVPEPIGVDKWRDEVLKSLSRRIKPLGYTYGDVAIPVYKKPSKKVKLKKAEVKEEPKVNVEVVAEKYAEPKLIPLEISKEELLNKKAARIEKETPDNFRELTKYYDNDDKLLGVKTFYTKQNRVSLAATPEFMTTKKTGGTIRYKKKDGSDIYMMKKGGGLPKAQTMGQSTYVAPSAKMMAVQKEFENKAKQEEENQFLDEVLKAYPTLKDRKQAKDFVKIKQREEQRGPDQLRQTPEAQNKLAKFIDVAANPFLALDTYRSTGTLPDYFTEKDIPGTTGVLDIPYFFTNAGLVSNLAETAKNMPSTLANMDYTNPWEYLGLGLDASMVLPGVRSAKRLVNSPAARLARMKTRKYTEPVKTLAKDIVQATDEAVVTPIQFRKEIKELKKLHEDYPKIFERPEAQERLRALGIDPSKMSMPKLIFVPNSGSGYINYKNPIYDPIINIDFRELRKLEKRGMRVPYKTTYEHELGHHIEREAFKNEYRKLYDDYNKSYEAYLDKLSNWEKTLDKIKKNPRANKYQLEAHIQKRPIEPNEPGLYKATSIGKDLYKIGMDKNKAFLNNQRLPYKNYQYYTSIGFPRGPIETFPHAREMRQNMLDAGVISDIYEPISSDKLLDFVRNNPSDRISSFVSESPENINALTNLLNRLPAAAPVIGAGAALSNSEEEYKKGGQFRKYQTEGEYNMERALELGYQPNEEGHWPSVDYETGEYLKSKKHPSAWKEYLYGYTFNPDQALNYDVRVNPEGYFGEDQLQYVPKKAKGGWLGKYQIDGQYTNKLNENQQFLISMVNSPLFEERYNKMTGDLKQIIPSYPSADLFRKNIVDNITSVKYAPEGEGDFTAGKEGGRTSAYYAPRHHTIYTSASKKDPYAQTHETSHASTLGSLFPTYPYSAKNRNPYKGWGKDLDTYYEPAYDNPNMQRYLSQPTEIKARIDAARKYMMDNNLYDPINQRFTEKDYNNFLFITDQSDIEDLKHNYSKEDIIRMFNEIVANNPKSKTTAKKGGPIVTTEGFKMGPPPQGSFYRIPSDTLYNPTDYRIKAVANTGEKKVLEPNTGDVTFKGAKYVDEYMMRKGGQLPKYQTDGEYIPLEKLPKDPFERVKWFKEHGYWDKFAPKKEKPAQELKPENRPQPKAKKLETNQTINRTIKENVTLSPVTTYSSARPVGPKQKGEPSRLYEFIQSVEDEGLWNALSQVGNYFEQKTSDVEKGVVPKRSTVVIDKPVKKLKKESSLPQIQILSDTIPDRLDNDKIYVGMSINANKNKFDYRNRLDSKDIKTKAGIAHTYNPFRSFDAYITQKDPDGYPMPIYEKNFEKGRPNSYEDNVIAINKNTGNLSVGIAKNFNNDYVLSRTLPPKIISDIYVGPEGKRNPNLNNKKTITLITPENNKISGQIAFGDTGFEMGGRGYDGGTILISTPDKKHTQFIYGSANDLKDQLNKFKSTYKTNKVLYYDLDQKAFSQAVQSKSGIIKGSKLREMDNTNSSGGHLIYLKENDQNLMKKGGAVKPKISYIRKDGRTVHK